jgi:hypothetical protein
MNWFFDFIANLFRPEYKHKYNYIPPQNFSHKSGWQQIKHPPNWVKNTLLKAPEYEPEQGIHYYPYCRGRHFEYCSAGGYPIFRRRIHRHK